MNTQDDEYIPWQEKTKASWLKLGFAEVMEWQVNVESYGGITVLMGGIKGLD